MESKTTKAKAKKKNLPKPKQKNPKTKNCKKHRKYQKIVNKKIHTHITTHLHKQTSRQS